SRYDLREVDLANHDGGGTGSVRRPQMEDRVVRAEPVGPESGAWRACMGGTRAAGYRRGRCMGSVHLVSAVWEGKRIESCVDPPGNGAARHPAARPLGRRVEGVRVGGRHRRCPVGFGWVAWSRRVVGSVVVGTLSKTA